VLAPDYKQHILSPAKAIKVCCSLAELYVISVYMNLCEWRGREVFETFKDGAQGIEAWEPRVYTKTCVMKFILVLVQRVQCDLDDWGSIPSRASHYRCNIEIGYGAHPACYVVILPRV
jgi:hypothetical protein